MPLLSITVRYSKKQIKGIQESELLAHQRKEFNERFKYSGKLKQSIITHGNPDGNGVLDPEKTVAIRTEAQVSEEEAAQIKKDLE